MSRFDFALRQLDPWEGVWSNRRTDPGGETVFGISRVSWPGWPGWSIVDQIKSVHPVIVLPGGGQKVTPELERALKSNARLHELRAAFYAENYWIPFKCEDFQVPIGEKLFELAVNLPPANAAKVLQATLCALDRPVRVDGVIGAKTIAAARSIEGGKLYDALQAGHACYYLGRNRPEYAAGWLARALAEDDIPPGYVGP